MNKALRIYHAFSFLLLPVQLANLMKSRLPQYSRYAVQFQMLGTQFSLFFLLFIGGMAVSRILYELFFPQLAWLGRPLTTLLLATFVAFAGWAIWLRTKFSFAWISLLPLLLNTLYLMDGTVDLVRSRLIFAASIWLTSLLWAKFEVKDAQWGWVGVGFIITALLPLYLLTMSAQVGRDDVFEFQVVTPQLGIVHPTGYPLYLLLGKLFTLLPIHSVAWRLNFGSTVYSLLTLSLLYWLLWRLWKRPFPAIFAAVALGLSPTFWSQAIIAEVYTLHALIVTAVLTLLIIGYVQNKPTLPFLKSRQHVVIAIFFLLGLGLTNHLTTIILIPVVVICHLSFVIRHSKLSTIHYPLSTIPAFLLPLLLYAYLPIRWLAVVGEPMGMGRFVDWVIGGRFQGALQLMAWLRDPTRYEIVGRLFLDNWGWFHLAIAFIGFVYFVYRQWRVGMLLFLTWLGFGFYCVSYYVPDLAVFLIPAQLIVAIWWGTGIVAIDKIWGWFKRHFGRGSFFVPSSLDIRVAILAALLFIPIIITAVSTFTQLDQSIDDGRTQWGTAVLNLPLAQNSAILADSDKYPPLFYLQQTEGIRSDIDISVWPDEAAYRAQLDGRLAAGQTVYLARFLPGLEGIYHLRSAGPLTEVSLQPLMTLPESATPSDLTFDSIRLLGYELELEAAVDDTQTAVTFYWQSSDLQSAQTISTVQYVYVRWENEKPTEGQHPANNDYPTIAWKSAEIVSDYHVWQRPILSSAATKRFQVALAPPFTPPNELEWQTVAEVDLEASKLQPLERPLRAQIGATTLTAVDFPIQLRPQQPLPLIISGSGTPQDLNFTIERENNSHFTLHTSQFAIFSPQILFSTELITPLKNGRFYLIASHPSGATCGWMRPSTTSCDLGEIEISGVPLPEGAANFEDKIALLNIDIAEPILQPGGQLAVTLNWQSLATFEEDYTVFVQVLDAQDRIVGQVDSWPVQGTYPTSQWSAGETVTDPYLIQLDVELPSGEYRLQVGCYLLATLRRLPILNTVGIPIDDKVTISGLLIP